MTTLTAVVTRIASVIRSLVLAYIVIQVLIWWPFYAVRPARLAGPAVAAVCCVAIVTALRRGRPGRALAAVEEAVRARPPHPVTLTVLASDDDVELDLAFAGPPAGPPEVSGLSGSVPAAAGWRAAVDVDETGAGCLEVRWWKQEAA